MATKTPLKVSVPRGQPLEPGQDLDTSEYVNEVGPHDEDLTTHPEYHENKLLSGKEQLQDKIDALKGRRGDDPEKVVFKRLPNTRAGTIRVSVTYPDGDRFNGNGDTTAAAVADLTAKLDLLFPVEEAK